MVIGYPSTYDHWHNFKLGGNMAQLEAYIIMSGKQFVSSGGGEWGRKVKLSDKKPKLYSCISMAQQAMKQICEIPNMTIKRVIITIQDEVSEVETLLAPRELSVANLLVAGRGIGQIAHELGVAERTAKIYRRDLFKKLKVKNVEELAQVMVSL